MTHPLPPPVPLKPLRVLRYCRLALIAIILRQTVPVIFGPGRSPVIFGQVVVAVEERVAVSLEAADEAFGARPERFVGEFPGPGPEGGDEHALLADVVHHQLRAGVERHG